MQWAFGFKLSAKTVKNDVKKLYEKVLVGVKEYISGKKGTLAIDGWKNPVTKEKHLCIVVQPISSERKTFFISSTVIRGTIDSDVIYHFLTESITELQAMDFTTVAVVGDNAPSQQAAFVKLMMHSIDSSIDKKTSENLLKFKRIVLSKFSVSDDLTIYTMMRKTSRSKLSRTMNKYFLYVLKFKQKALWNLFDGPRPACIARSPQIFGGPAQFRP